jgi:hypothetical protein
MTEKPKRYYYYANERGCLKSPESIDEIGVGIDAGRKSCCLTIHLLQLKDDFGGPHFTMEATAHNDEWGVFSACRDVLNLLSKRTIPSGEMRDTTPFYALRIYIEKLGYKNLGILSHQMRIARVESSVRCLCGLSGFPGKQ